MSAGATSTPGLGEQVKARVEPWTQFATAALDQVVGESPLAAVVDPAEIAHAVVALYLGLELLSHLDGDRRAALALFDRARHLAALADLVTGSTPSSTPSSPGPSSATPSSPRTQEDT
jgi:hypothetical protein